MSVRVVYDTMVFVQATSRPGRVHRTMRAVEDGSVSLCLSADVMAELREVLMRPSLHAHFPDLTMAGAEAFLTHIDVGDTM